MVERYGSRVLYPREVSDTRLVMKKLTGLKKKKKSKPISLENLSRSNIQAAAAQLARNALKTDKPVQVKDIIYSKKLNVFVAVYPWEDKKKR